MLNRILNALLRLGHGAAIAMMLMFGIVAADRAGLLPHRNVLDIGRDASVAQASQGNCVMPTTGTVSGLTLVTNINTCLSAILTANSGSSAPTNGAGALPQNGQIWKDTSVSPNIVRIYDGTSWLPIGGVDATNHIWLGALGGGLTTIASAATTDLWSVPQASISITGTTTITALASASAVPGTLKVVTFTGVTTLTQNATSLILPTAANITTQVGDYALVLALSATNVAVVAYTRADGTMLSAVASVASFNLLNSALGFSAPLNLRLNASVLGNALTIALKGVNNADPSASNPVLVSFRDPTLANGDPVVVSIQAATSIVIPSTATLGAASGSALRGWIVLYNNGGTAVLGVINCTTSAGVYPLAENGVVSPTSGASNSSGVHYSAAGVTAGSAYRIVGFFEYGAGLATAGTYNIPPTTVQIFGPGIKKPGDVVQTVSTSTNSIGSTGSSTFTALTGGLTQAITPTSGTSLIRVTASGTMSQSSAGNSFIQIMRNGSLIGYPIKQTNVTGGPFFTPATIVLIDAPGTAGSITYGFQGKSDVGILAYPASGTGLHLTIEEIMGALPEPANDDGGPMRMVG